jgi:dienelactone hydrolase
LSVEPSFLSDIASQGKQAVHMSTEFTPLSEPPSQLAQWHDQREALRHALWERLGDLPPLFTPQATVLQRTERDGYIVEKLVFDNGTGSLVYGYFLLPAKHSAPLPAVIYQHMHGGQYPLGKDELFIPRVPGLFPGPELVKAGFAVLAMDAYCFGDRQDQSLFVQAEFGAMTEQALAKHFLWQGSTLWGMMARDDLLGLNYLVTRPEVDTTRIGVTGMSLGASRTTWLAAMDDRPKVVVPVAQMTRYKEFAEAGKYNGHGIYYYVPGILKTGLEMDHLAALAAPRLQAILIGDSDPLSPIDGIRRVCDYVEKIYDLYGASDNLIVEIERGVGHVYTPTMFAAMMETLKRGLEV